MRIAVRTLDDALRRSFEIVVASGKTIEGGRRGTIREIVGMQIEIDEPRARLSRYETRSTTFACIGELLWYLAGDEQVQFMEYYIPDYRKFVVCDAGGKVLEAYGPRLFHWGGTDQVRRVISLLRQWPSSKKGVIQLFDHDDLGDDRGDAPCTCLLQYLSRDGRLEAITTMRSNDAVRGLPHDVFAFTFLQELIARSLGLELGTYRHWVGSFHIYERDSEMANRVLAEGWQQSVGVEMPAMPAGDPWPFVERLLEAERAFRIDQRSDQFDSTGSVYWDVLIWLLEIKRHVAARDLPRAEAAWLRRPLQCFDDFVERQITRIRTGAAS